MFCTNWKMFWDLKTVVQENTTDVQVHFALNLMQKHYKSNDRRFKNFIWTLNSASDGLEITQVAFAMERLATWPELIIK